MDQVESAGGTRKTTKIELKNAAGETVKVDAIELGEMGDNIDEIVVPKGYRVITVGNTMGTRVGKSLHGLLESGQQKVREVYNGNSLIMGTVRTTVLCVDRVLTHSKNVFQITAWVEGWLLDDTKLVE